LNEFNFLVLGDWGRRGVPGQLSVATGMAMTAARLRPRFVVTTGDNFYERGVRDCEDLHWRESFADIYNARDLNVPWHPVLGNHDWWGDPACQVAYSERCLRWCMPALYYDLSYRLRDGNILQLLFLDTTPLVSDYWPGGRYEIPGIDGADPAVQLGWLESVLSRSTAKYRIVVGHHPIASASPFHGDCPDLEQRLLPLLRRYGVNVYLCGHEHDLQHLVCDGLHHVVCGAAAEARESGWDARTQYAAALLGFGAVSVTAQGLLLRFFGQDGDCLYEASLERPPETLRLVGS
jgi:3',5'-cyclic AMP phosphodiesterase CpdA